MKSDRERCECPRCGTLYVVPSLARDCAARCEEAGVSLRRDPNNQA